MEAGFDLTEIGWWRGHNHCDAALGSAKLQQWPNSYLNQWGAYSDSNTRQWVDGPIWYVVESKSLVEASTMKAMLQMYHMNYQIGPSKTIKLQCDSVHTLLQYTYFPLACQYQSLWEFYYECFTYEGVGISIGVSQSGCTIYQWLCYDCLVM